MSSKEMTKQNEKQIHFYFGGTDGRYSDGAVHTYKLTKLLIELESERIDTTQIILCKTDLFRKGYKIFIHPVEGNAFEIKLGDNSPYTDKEIRMGHNLYKMLIAGTFNTIGTTVC